MDIRKLQRVIVDGLEDVKGQNILVFNTEHLSSLFERVIIASGTSNRQTKSLASSVREAVKDAGFPVPRTEGESNGEWIIVDCGAAVVHVMQPTIRDFYHLEEIWGDKPVRMKIDSAAPKLVKAGDPDKPVSATTAKKIAATPATPPPGAAAWTRGPTRAGGAAKKGSGAGKTTRSAEGAAAKQAAAKAPPTRKAIAMPGAVVKKAVAKKVAPQRLVTRVVGLKKPTAKKTAVKGASAVTKKAATRTFTASTAPRRPAAKKAASRP